MGPLYSRFLPIVTQGKGISQDVLLRTTCTVLVAAEVIGRPADVQQHQQIYMMKLVKEVTKKLNVDFDLDGILEAIVTNETF